MHVSLLLVHMAFLHVLFVHIYCEKYAVLIHDSILKQGFGWFLPRRQLEKEASDVSLGHLVLKDGMFWNSSNWSVFFVWVFVNFSNFSIL